MTKNQERVYDIALTVCSKKEHIDESFINSAINSAIAGFSSMYPIGENEKQEILQALLATLAVTMDRGCCIREANHKVWFIPMKSKYSLKFWNRYAQYLRIEKHYSPSVVKAIDSATDEMVDSLGNPESEGSFQRRGLVIGDVQSGKTGTYIGLINKAADVGYHVFILLTGTIEKLRRQTQERIDLGFVGLDSGLVNNMNIGLTPISQIDPSNRTGVSKIDPSITAFVFTSTVSDFKIKSNPVGKLSSISAPVIFVVKKNKTVLDRLIQWLISYNSNSISEPMLLIDDEADSASINTNKDQDDPTAINMSIRKLLSLFQKSNYMGFTATPFANIFIDPTKNEQQMICDDLFPKDFIYALEPPNNYIGPRSIFGSPQDSTSSQTDHSNGKFASMLHYNDDCNNFLPLDHKKNASLPDALPPSLDQALASFFIINAIRDLRGEYNSHRTMMINISRFINIQNSLMAIIGEKVDTMQTEIRNYSKTGNRAMHINTFILLKDTYDNLFSFPNIPSWEAIQSALSKSASSIVVKSINGGNAVRELNYEDYEPNHEDNDGCGLRLIAIGGFSLSRGLTLEGLCVSYFFRNSKMYDTLMQMGRWFGYRKGYEDLCQVWMSRTAIDWYRHISLATDELRNEVYRMRNRKQTPSDFGLMVRSDPETLIITAKNKMRSAQDYSWTVNLSGEVIETPYLPMDKEQANINTTITNNLLLKMGDNGYPLKDLSANGYALHSPQALNVPKCFILELLSSYISHSSNINFKTEDIVKIIENTTDGSLDSWDVSIATGEGEPIQNYGGIEILRPVQRSFLIKENIKALQMSGTSSHLSSNNMARTGLTLDDAANIERKIREETGNARNVITQNEWFKTGYSRNPALVIFPVELKPDINDKGYADIKNLIMTFQRPMIGLAIGIPAINGKQSKKIAYKMNSIMAQQVLDVKDPVDFLEETGEDEY